MIHLKEGDIIRFDGYYGKSLPKIGKVMAICAFYYANDNHTILRMEPDLNKPLETLKSATILINCGWGCSVAVPYENVVAMANEKEVFAWEISN